MLLSVDRGDAFGPMAAFVRGGGIATTLGVAVVDALAERNVRATNLVGTPTAEKPTRLAEAAASGSLRVEVQGPIRSSRRTRRSRRSAAGRSASWRS